MSLLNAIQNLFPLLKPQASPAAVAKPTFRSRQSPPLAAKSPVRQVFSKNGEAVSIEPMLKEGSTSTKGGGEGTIHRVSDMPGKLIKIYHDHILSDPAKSREIQAKIEAMCSFGKWTENEPFCWPRMPVFDERRRWIGYAMREGRGKVVHLLCSPYTVTKEFPGWDRADLLIVALRIAEGLGSLHSKGVLVGDVSTGNYLADPKSKAVSFVDCDSYHIRTAARTFPCTVRTMNFSPPEVISKRVSMADLTPDQECFSSAILFFQILMMGLHPFSHVGNDTPLNNIVAGRCALGKNSDAQLPQGPWRNIWSHLPYKVKGLFVRCFRDGHSAPNQRPNLSEWINVLGTYHNEMTKLGFHDRSLLPTKPKSTKWNGGGQKYSA